MALRQSSRSKSSQSGFTLIEVMVGLLIITATAASVFYGVTYARAEIRKIVIRERALEELSGYMEYWVAMINYNQMSVPERNGDSQGEEVILYDPTNNEDKAIVGKIYREPLSEGHSEYNPTNNPYYVLKARIVWEDHLSDNETAELYLETKAFNF